MNLSENRALLPVMAHVAFFYGVHSSVFHGLSMCFPLFLGSPSTMAIEIGMFRCSDAWDGSKSPCCRAKRMRLHVVTVLVLSENPGNPWESGKERGIARGNLEKCCFNGMISWDYFMVQPITLQKFKIAMEKHMKRIGKSSVDGPMFQSYVNLQEGTLWTNSIPNSY